MMKKIIALFCILCLLSCAYGDMPATPTDLQDFIELDDNDFGTIDESLLPRQVYLQWLKEPLFIGEEVTLVAILINFLPTDNYTFLWEYALNEQEANKNIWHIIENANEQIYTFTLNNENCHYYWRVQVTLTNYRGENYGNNF